MAGSSRLLSIRDPMDRLPPLPSLPWPLPLPVVARSPAGSRSYFTAICPWQE
jgi:hypothetical protein